MMLRVLCFQLHSTIMLSLQSGGDRSHYLYLLLFLIVALAALLVGRVYGHRRRILRLPSLNGRGTEMTVARLPDGLHAPASGDPSPDGHAPTVPLGSVAAGEQPWRVPAEAAAPCDHMAMAGPSGLELASPSLSKRNEAATGPVAQLDGAAAAVPAAADLHTNLSRLTQIDAEQMHDQRAPLDPSHSNRVSPRMSNNADELEAGPQQRRLPPLRIRIHHDQLQHRTTT